MSSFDLTSVCSALRGQNPRTIVKAALQHFDNIAISFSGAEDVVLEPGELFVVPKGVEHCPRADEETHVLLIEPSGTRNTGDAGGPLTANEETI